MLTNTQIHKYIESTAKESSKLVIIHDIYKAQTLFAGLKPYLQGSYSG
jgi:hypothetical protein